MNNKDFEWNDELACEFHRFIMREAGNCPSDKSYLQRFKEEKRKKSWEVVSMDEYNRVLSLKRLSDGEVFVIGDRLDDMDDDPIIDRFWFGYNGNEVWVGTNSKLNYGCALSVAKKKNVLFTTEDGVEYFNRNELVWSVCPKALWDTRCPQKVHYAMSAKAWKHFSTEEKMNEFIIMNKPLLSVNDLVNIQHCIIYGNQIEKFKELAKSKMNAKQHDHQ